MTAPKSVRRPKSVGLVVTNLEDRVTPTNYTVTSISDSGAGTLRQAILDANGNAGSDTIDFTGATFATPQTINLTTGEMKITEGVTITGPAARVTISGAAAASTTNRIFNVDNATAGAITVDIKNLTLTGGNTTTSGGAVYLQDEIVNFTNVVIAGNKTTVDGGAVCSGNPTSTGTVNLVDSTVSGNTAGDDAGGIYFYSGGSFSANRSTFSGNVAAPGTAGDGGALYLFGTTAQITNSTFSGNSAGRGGAIAIKFSGTVTIENSTITNNTALGVGGVNAAGGIARTSAGATILKSTIVAGNTFAAAPDVSIVDAQLTADNSLIGAADGLTITGANNLTGTIAAPLDPQLRPLANNGGPTNTHRPIGVGPVINKGTAGSQSVDQRGLARTVGAAADIGAFEFQASEPLAPPIAGGLVAPTVTVAGGTSYSFTVIYTDDSAIDVSSVIGNNAAITVTGPTGPAVAATYVTINTATNGAPRTVTYNFTPPGGTWDPLDNGAYTVAIVGSQVKSTVGSFVPAGTLGTFLAQLPQTYTVTNTNDTGAGSLRAAVISANGNGGPDLIIFDPSVFGTTPQTINLATGQIAITDSVTINGPGPSLLTVSNTLASSANSRVFNVGGTGILAVNMSGMAVTGGNLSSGSGAGILNTDETLTLTDMVIAGNNVTGTGAGIAVSGAGILTLNRVTVDGNKATSTGGGIRQGTAGTTKITDSTISNNEAGGNGGGILHFSAGTIIITNSTISGNKSAATGGGVYFWGSSGGFSVTNSTVSGNTAVTGGGIALLSLTANANIWNSTVAFNTGTAAGGGIARTSGTVGVLSLFSTVVAKNAGNAASPDISMSNNSLTANNSLIGVVQTGLTVNGTSNQGGTTTTPLDPVLGPLQNNGGPTFTHANLLDAGGKSPLRNVGSNVLGLATDQRGRPRVDQGQTDIGSFEFAPPRVSTITTTSPSPTNSSNVDFIVTFTDPVTSGLTAANFALVTTGTATGTIDPPTSVDGGRTYTVRISSISGTGTIQLNVANGTGTSPPLAGPFPVHGPVVQVDLDVPTVSITRAGSSPTNAASVSWTVTFSEAVTGVTLPRFTLTTSGLTGAALTGITGGPIVFTVTASTGTGDGTIGLNLPNPGGAIQDFASNALFASFPVIGPTFAIDKTQPTATVTRVGAADTNAASVQWTVAFSEAVTGLAGGNFSLPATGTVSGAGVASITGGPLSFTVTVNTGTGDGTLGLTLANSAGLTDLAGNAVAGLSVVGAGYTIDKTNPTAAITRLNPSPSNAGTVQWSVLFSESVSTLTAANFTLVAVGLTGSSITSVTGAGTAYTVTASAGAGDGTLGLNLASSGGLADVAGNLVTPVPTVGQVYALDRINPTAVITLTDPNPTGVAVVHYTVTFSEPVTPPGGANFVLVQSGVSGALITSIAGGPTVYTVTVNTGTGDGTLGLDLPSAAGITDAVGNLLAGAPLTGPVYSIDKSPPTVTSITLNDPSLTNLGTVSWTVVFRKVVTGVAPSNFVLTQSGGITGAGITSVTGSGTTYTVTAATGTGDGILGLDVTAAGSVQDVAGNSLIGLPFGGPAYAIDKTSPTPIITLFSQNPTNAASVSWTVTFDEPVAGVSAANFSLVATGLSGTAITAVFGGGTTYTVIADTGTGDGTLGLDLTSSSGLSDLAGNASTFAAGAAFTIDKTAPFATSITRVAPSLTNAGLVAWLVTFSEPVSGISAGTFTTLEGGGLSGSSYNSFTGSGTTFTVYANTGTGDGTVALRLASGAGFTDAAGNAVTPTPVDGPAFDIDKTHPGVTIVRNLSTTTNAPSVSWSIIFSEPVFGLTAANFALTSSGLTPSSIASVTGGGANYTVTATTGTGDGLLGLTMTNTTGVTDAAGNVVAPVPAVGPAFTIDKIAPTVTIARIGFSPTNAGPISWRVVFSEPVATLSAANFDLANVGVSGATITSVTGFGTTFTVVANTGTGDGTIGLTLANSTGLSDPAGNPVGGLPLTAATYVIDNTPPTATLTASVSDPTPQATFLVTATFSEPVIGFALTDVVVTNGTPAGFTVVGPSEYRFTVTASALGPVTVTIPVFALSDAAGNLLASSATLSRTVNTPNPIPVVTTAVPSPTNGPIPVTILFDQPVTGFTAGDVQTTNATVTAFTVVSPVEYTFVLVPVANGTVSASIPAGAAANSLGLPSAAVAVPAVQFDGTAPTAVVAAAAGQTDPASGLPVRFAVTFSEAVFGFDASDVTVGGTAPGARVASVSGSGASYVVTVSGPTDSGTVTLAVKAAAAADATGNASTASGTAAVTYVNPTPPPPPVTGLPATSLPDRIAVGNGAGNQVQARNAGGASLFEGEVLATGFTGGVRVASGDFNGDGIPDIVVGSGPGSVTLVRVLSGKDRSELFATQPFEASFTGGVFVAAGDLTGDGRADLVVTPDEGGGARTRIFTGAGFGLVADFLGIDDPAFRGGARAAVGDLNGDGRADLVVAAGFGGGPRLAAFDGHSVGRIPTRLFADFFVFEPSLRNGAYVAAGDLNGDGFAEIVAGGGPGGAPRVYALNGQALTQSHTQVQMANFFAGNTASRGGVRVAVFNLDNDNRADLVVGAGEGDGSTVAAYYGRNIPTNGTPATAFVFDAFPGLTGGVYVG